MPAILRSSAMCIPWCMLIESSLLLVVAVRTDGSLPREFEKWRGIFCCLLIRFQQKFWMRHWQQLYYSAGPNCCHFVYSTLGTAAPASYAILVVKTLRVPANTSILTSIPVYAIVPRIPHSFHYTNTGLLRRSSLVCTTRLWPNRANHLGVFPKIICICVVGVEAKGILRIGAEPQPQNRGQRFCPIIIL